MAVKVEGHLWLHSVETCVLAGAAIFTTSFYGPGWGLHPWQLAIGYLIIGMLAGLTVLITTDSVILAAYSFIWGCFGVIWTMLAQVFGIWSRGLLFTLTLFTFSMALMGAILMAKRRAEMAEQVVEQLAIEAKSEQREFEEFLTSIELPGIRVERIVNTRNGKDYLVRLPKLGRISLDSLEMAKDRIERGRNLRRGAVRIIDHEDMQADEAIIRVTTKHVLKDMIMFPMDELALRSVNDPFPIGLYENGDLAMVRFREAAGLIIGQRGKGKSNLINVLIAQLALCNDVIICMIDMKGGRTARPWLEAWVNGEAERPVLDWVATTRDEAETMLVTLNSWIEERSFYSNSAEKVTPAPGEPAIVLIVDEMARIFGQGWGPKHSQGETTNFTLTQMAKNLVTQGRSEAIDPIWATQRGTVTMVGDGDMKSQCDLRFALGASTEADIRCILPDDAQAPKWLARLGRIPGVIAIAHGDTSIDPLKSYRIDPESDDIRQISIFAGSDKPEPEQRLQLKAGTAYSERWKRPAGQTLIERVAGGKRGPKDLLTDDIDDEFEALAERAKPRLDERHVRLLELLREKGLVGYSPFSAREALVKEFGEDRAPAREVVQRWLTEDAKEGTLRVRNPGSRDVRYSWIPTNDQRTA